MNITVLAVVVAVCLCVTDGAPDGRLTRKQQRPTRGFKNVEMMTARGFGKRARTEHEEIRRKFHPKFPLMVAYEFGKRSGNDEVNEEEFPQREVMMAKRVFKPNSNVLIARAYGKRQENNGVYGMDNFWENLEASQEKDGVDGNDEKTLESIPLDWFINEMINNPDFTRSVVRKFIDLNQDGMLSSEELLRNV